MFKKEDKLNTGYFFETQGSFDIADYYTAKQAFGAWQAKQAQDIDDFLIRQRKAELNALVKKVIENELTESEKTLIDLRWNKNYSLERIASILSIDPSTVHRRLEKITDNLYEKLKYALEYRFGKCNQKASVLVKSEIEKSVIEKNLNSFGARLRALRKENQLELSDLGVCVGINEKRLKKIEDGNANVRADEIISLASFYRVSSDYLLFGKVRVLRDPFTGLPMKCKC